MNLNTLRVLFPSCTFHQYDTIYHIYFNFNLYFCPYGITFSNNPFDITMFKNMYETIDYVTSFLKANNFVPNTKFGNKNSAIKDNITVYFCNYYFIDISGDRQRVDADELISMIKKELNIETLYKPVLE